MAYGITIKKEFIRLSIEDADDSIMIFYTPNAITTGWFHTILEMFPDYMRCENLSNFNLQPAPGIVFRLDDELIHPGLTVSRHVDVDVTIGTKRIQIPRGYDRIFVTNLPLLTHVTGVMDRAQNIQEEVASFLASIRFITIP